MPTPFISRIPARAAIAAVLLSGCWSPALADTYPRQPGIDVRGYVFRIEVKDDTPAISAEADVEVAFKADTVRKLWLDLIAPSADGKTGMTVSSVTSGADSLAFTHEGGRIRVQLGAAGKAGDRRRVTIRYAGVPADGLLIGPNKHAERVFFGDNFPDRARHWLPTIDHPSDKASCEFVITAPEAYQVVAPGALIETSSLTGNRRVTRYRETVPITTYSMVIGVARFAVETIGETGGALIQSWVYPQERDPGFADFRIALKPMQLFSWRVGPYSYEKLANVQSKTRYGGMENASTIFYSERVVTGRGTNEGLFAHEIAHQWFGDSVTESDWDHTWLSEGFATYFTHVYNEYTFGRDTMVRGLRRDRDSIVRFFERNPASAIVTPANPKLDNILSTNSYQKGGWFLHMLRRLVGDEVFWRGVSTYYARYQNGNALTDDFRRVMEEVSGKPLEEFFRQWVFTPGQPTVAGSWAWADGVLTVEIRQTQPAATVYTTALDLGIVVDRAAAPRVETVTLDQRAQTFTFQLDKEPADVVLDPNTWLLMQAGEFSKKAGGSVTRRATGR
jgi:aminopeptidase N